MSPHIEKRVRVWIGTRKATLLLSFGLILWFGIQLAVSSYFGQEAAEWLFYSEKPPGNLSPGSFLSPISHDMDSITHILGNVGLLLAVGSLAEPYIGKSRIIVLVVFIGFFGTVLANSLAIITNIIGLSLFGWMIAGASGGILSLWAYTSLRLKPLAHEFRYLGIEKSVRGVERFTAAILLISVPAIPVFELIILGMFNSGHTMGLIVGLGAYLFEQRFWGQRTPVNHISINSKILE